MGDFLQRYVEHIPPPRFHMVRRYGIYAGSLQHLLQEARMASAATKSSLVTVASATLSGGNCRAEYDFEFG